MHKLAIETGDFPAQHLTDLEKGSNGLPQQTLLVDQIFDPAAEDIALGRADDQADILEQTADLVVDIALGLDQLGPAVEQRPHLMTGQALDLDLLVPTALHDPRQADGVVAVGLVDLQRQRRLGVARIDADHRQAECSKFVPQPSTGRTGLKTNARGAACLRLDERRNRRRLRDHRAFRHDRAAAIDHANRCLLERYIHSNIHFHSCSPDR